MFPYAVSAEERTQHTENHRLHQSIRKSRQAATLRKHDIVHNCSDHWRKEWHRYARLECSALETFAESYVSMNVGKAFLTAYAARDNVLVIAAIRDGPDSAPARELEALPTGTNSKVIVAKYDATSEQSVHDMVAYLQSEHNIRSLDIVIASAGILKQWGPRDVKSEDILEHFTVHTLGAIRLYRATIGLLDKSVQTPKFFIISSALGSNGLMDQYAGMKMIAYNMAKGAQNLAAGRIHREEDRLIIIPVQPGWIATDMGSRAAVYAGMKASDPPVALEDSVAGLLKLFDRATKEEHSGRFWNQKGEEIPW